ncbi:MAG TPA: hypothetical protein VGG89_06285 [Candidatus Baltobacteraceae bacterium]
MSYQDILDLTAYVLGATELMHDAITKAPADMPKDFPYVFYAGKDAGGKPVLWISSAVSAHVVKPPEFDREVQREEEASAMLATLDMGKASSNWQRVYATVKNDPARLAALGAELEGAIRDMSAAIVAISAANRQWMFANLTEGMPRAQVYRALRLHGLAAKGDVVSLPGRFEPGCYFSTNVTMTFDASERLDKMDLSQPIPDCL